MTPPGGTQPNRGLALAIGTPIALLLLLLTGSIVAWFILGLPRRDSW